MIARSSVLFSHSSTPIRRKSVWGTALRLMQTGKRCETRMDDIRAVQWRACSFYDMISP